MDFPRLSIVLFSLLLSPLTFGGGMAVHMFQSEKAFDQIEADDLKQLLRDNKNAWLSGTQYPDAGYAPGTLGEEQHVWGEASHWAPFILVYLDVVKERCEGFYLSDPYCGQLTAHFLGAAAHGLQDQVFDALFIPKVTEVDNRGQDSTDIGIDMILLQEHNRHAAIPQPWFTPVEQLEVVYDRMGFTESEANSSQIISATKLSELGNLGERLISPFLYWRYKQDMPWGSRNYMSYPGGVEFGGITTANFWNYLWQQLNSELNIEYAKLTHLPTHNATDVAVSKRRTDNHISVTFDRYIIPSSVNDSSFRVIDEDGLQVNGSLSLFANASQDHAEANMIKFFPNETLKFDTQYQVKLTADILDGKSESALGYEGYQWQFHTEKNNNYVQIFSQGYCLSLNKYTPNSTSIPIELQICADTRHQQWAIDTENRWHNRSRPDLCLQPKNGFISWQRVYAVECNDSHLQRWEFTSASRKVKVKKKSQAMGTFFSARHGSSLMFFPSWFRARQLWDIVSVDEFWL